MTEQQLDDIEQQGYINGWLDRQRSEPVISAVLLGLAFLAGMLLTHFAHATRSAPHATQSAQVGK